METNKWYNYKKINNGLLSNNLIKYYLSQFWNDVMLNLDTNQ